MDSAGISSVEIREGWATQYGAHKFDVSVNETDLARVCEEHGITAAYRDKLTPSHAFLILHTLALFLSARARVSAMSDSESRQAAIGKLEQVRLSHANTVAAVRKAVGAPEPEVAHAPA